MAVNRGLVDALRVKYTELQETGTPNFQPPGPEVLSTPTNSSLGLLLKAGDNLPGACGSTGCTLQDVKFAPLEHFCEEKHGQTDSCLWNFQLYFSQSDCINL